MPPHRERHCRLHTQTKCSVCSDIHFVQEIASLALKFQVLGQ